jgi:23S rRNA (cytidine1920-2'-O)/16S rRNA (cytidine1409-2'-O)-methyltransferase
LVSLIKPQFEVPKGLVNFNGVVQDRSVLVKVMRNVYDLLARDGVGMHRLAKSPITGHKGNTEFLSLLKMQPGLSKDEMTAQLEELLS